MSFTRVLCVPSALGAPTTTNEPVPLIAPPVTVPVKVDNKNLVTLVNFHEEMRPLVTGPESDSVWSTGASPILWPKGFNGSGIVCGVIDTGICEQHPVFAGKTINRVDYVRDGLPSRHFHPHGTHVAGIIAGSIPGVFSGMAPGCIIRDYRVLDTNGSGTITNVTAAVIRATADRCDVINMSLGGSYPSPTLRTAIQRAVARGILVICAAGNSGPNSRSYPAQFPESISVGAVEYNSSEGILTLPATPWFSTTNVEVDLCADGYMVTSSVGESGYATWSGTSMAAPHVAGMACLIKQKFVSQFGRQPDAHRLELRSLLMSATLPTAINGVFQAELQGAGYCTVLPEIPKFTDNVWTMPSYTLL